MGLRTIKIVVATLMLTSVGASPTFAHDGSESRTTDRVMNKVEDNSKSVKNVAETTITDTTKRAGNAEDRARTQSENVESRKTELKEQLKQGNDDRKEALKDRRLAQCQNREATINDLLDKGTKVGQDRLARIQGVKAKVKAFYEKQQLSDDRYASMVQMVDEKEAATIAALQVLDEQEFKCESVDASDTSKPIRTSRNAKQDALQNYRESVKQLIVIVKDAYSAKQSAKSSEVQR